MNTRPQETLSYRDLARQQAQITRQIGLEALPRLKDLVDNIDAADVASAVGSEPDPCFEVVLRFGIDARGMCRVEGELSGRVPLNCNGCAEVLVHPMEMAFDCVIAETEAIADRLVDELLATDVLVANGTGVTVAQIVEDEILLNLPERLCTREPCNLAPELAYPAPGIGDGDASVSEPDGHPDDGDNPFSVLAGLTRKDEQ